jgi:hypothetical protein
MWMRRTRPTTRPAAPALGNLQAKSLVGDRRTWNRRRCGVVGVHLLDSGPALGSGNVAARISTGATCSLATGRYAAEHALAGRQEDSDFVVQIVLFGGVVFNVRFHDLVVGRSHTGAASKPEATAVLPVTEYGLTPMSMSRVEALVRAMAPRPGHRLVTTRITPRAVKTVVRASFVEGNR